jgi:hypothetical protein
MWRAGSGKLCHGGVCKGRVLSSGPNRSNWSGFVRVWRMVFSLILIARHQSRAQIRIGRRKGTVGAVDAGKPGQQKPQRPKSR